MPNCLPLFYSLWREAKTWHISLRSEKLMLFNRISALCISIAFTCELEWLSSMMEREKKKKRTQNPLWQQQTIHSYKWPSWRLPELAFRKSFPIVTIAVVLVIVAFFFLSVFFFPDGFLGALTPSDCELVCSNTEHASSFYSSKKAVYFFEILIAEPYFDEMGILKWNNEARDLRSG